MVNTALTPDLYGLLGVEREATVAQIKTSYKKLALVSVKTIYLNINGVYMVRSGILTSIRRTSVTRPRRSSRRYLARTKFCPMRTSENIMIEQGVSPTARMTYVTQTPLWTTSCRSSLAVARADSTTLMSLWTYWRVVAIKHSERCSVTLAKQLA